MFYQKKKLGVRGEMCSPTAVTKCECFGIEREFGRIMRDALVKHWKITVWVESLWILEEIGISCDGPG
jgi:hypothetical protein